MSSLFQYRTVYANRDFAPPAVVAGEKILIQISGQQLITFVIALAYLKPIISESPIKLAVGSLAEKQTKRTLQCLRLSPELHVR